MRKMIFKQIILLSLIAAAYTADVSSSYSLLEKHSAFNPEFKTEPHPIAKKETKDEESHPIFKPEEHPKVRIAPVKPNGDVVQHEMLADEPATQNMAADVNRVDTLAPTYGYVQPPMEVAYPDVPYAPGYGYDPAYQGNTGYTPYNTEVSNYYLEPDTSALSYLWNQVPDSRSIASFLGRTFVWVFNSAFVILFGSLITVAFCSYTQLCSITFNGMGPIHEEMRSFMNPESLEKLGHAAEFVKTAIDKYQKIQEISGQRMARKVTRGQ